MPATISIESASDKLKSFAANDMALVDHLEVQSLHDLEDEIAQVVEMLHEALNAVKGVVATDQAMRIKVALWNGLFIARKYALKVHSFEAKQYQADRADALRDCLSELDSLHKDSFAIPEWLNSMRVAEPKDRRTWSAYILAIDQLRKIGANWDGAGAESPSNEVVDSAVLFAKYCFQLGLTPPARLAPTVTGGVILEWQGESTYGHAEVTVPFVAEFYSSTAGSPSTFEEIDFSSLRQPQ